MGGNKPIRWGSLLMGEVDHSKHHVHWKDIKYTEGLLMGEVDHSKHHVHWKDIKYTEVLLLGLNYILCQIRWQVKSNSESNTNYLGHPCCILICTLSDFLWFWWKLYNLLNFWIKVITAFLYLFITCDM